MVEGAFGGSTNSIFIANALDQDSNIPASPADNRNHKH
jgi:hypothetical protein